MKFYSLVLVLLPLTNISCLPSHQKQLSASHETKSAPLTTGSTKLDLFLKNSKNSLTNLNKLDLDPSKYVEKAKNAVRAIPNDLPQKVEGLKTQFSTVVGMNIEEANKQSKKVVKRYNRYITSYKKSPSSQIDYTKAAKRALAETAAEYKAKSTMKNLMAQFMD